MTQSTLRKAKPQRAVFTRDNPSSLLGDIFWILAAICAILVLTAQDLVQRRSEFRFVINGSADNVDFTNIDPVRVAQYLTNHTELIQKELKYGNMRIHFLASIIDPLPKSISRPSSFTYFVAIFCFLFFILRFAIRYNNWRYNKYFISAAWLVFGFALGATPLGLGLSIHVGLKMSWPFLGALSVVVHRLLGDRAWKPDGDTIVKDAEYGPLGDSESSAKKNDR
ncbi:hypothetical protein K469DRAFT_748700 [Zopfia rhizophila CBS 207.26]|uniref:Uncharacterized protein n=1 Tax=Zopfia rhizophila CBS 207.26 TaxID=1314779 RepID=A0A6A6E946_9PEZI|nr:hypothetical protein K469DRAFT_748700 [Zopfia rhizophila CBS 207.26]